MTNRPHLGAPFAWTQTKGGASKEGGKERGWLRNHATAGNSGKTGMISFGEEDRSGHGEYGGEGQCWQS